MTQKKKVVHMTTVHHPYDTRIYHKECLSLKKAGFDVSLIATMDEKDRHESTVIDMVPLRRRKGRFRRMVFSTWEAYRKARLMRADCYHIHDPELLPVGWLLKTKYNVVIYDIHEDYTTSITQKEYMLKGLQGLFARVYKFTEKLFSRKMALCLAEKYYLDKYPEGTCILNYPIINKKVMNTDSGTLPSENKLLYTGNVSVDRGAFIHAHIPKIDPSVSVHCVGKCPADLAKAMHTITGDAANRLSIEGIDTFIEREDIDATYVERNWLAGLALFPPTDHYMRKELTKFFEYMAAGIPIICSNFPLWEDFMEQYGCGIAVDPNRPQAITEAIRYLQMNPNETKQMGNNGKRAIMEKLNWQHEEPKLIHLYHNLLNN